MPTKPSTIGRILSKAGTVSGLSVTWTVPAKKTWRFVCARGTLTTDATASNRLLVVRVYDENNNMLYNKEGSGNVGASTTAGITVADGVDTRNSTNPVYLQIPANLHLNAGMKVEAVVASGGQAGDALTDFYALVEEYD